MRSVIDMGAGRGRKGGGGNHPFDSDCRVATPQQTGESTDRPDTDHMSFPQEEGGGMASRTLF